ncbi:ExbD/TolR family protein [Teredinibacter purpureus]|uniref:ExbD/TolR family protein n=1 Tax=Teredinibacter purpureus TaxID=2731756 RepID=UPI0005F860A9|nr:biopolymer transporter ExbD [Teredinibacter purpureus]
MQFKRQVKAEEQVNLTPLIDVVFLLLIFFMVSTTFTKETHLKIDLPEAVGDKQPTVVDQIEVVVDSHGGYSVNGRALVNKQINTLRTAILDVGGGNTGVPFIITGDANTPYQIVISVMDLAGDMGYGNLSLTTQTPEEGDENSRAAD